MNITKRQLKKIIKEELRVVLNEVYAPEGEGYEAARREAGVAGYGQGITADDILRPDAPRMRPPLEMPPEVSQFGEKPGTISQWQDWQRPRQQQQPIGTYDEYLDEEEAYLDHMAGLIDAELAAEAAGGRVKGIGGLEYPRPSDAWQPDWAARHGGSWLDAAEQHPGPVPELTEPIK
jgi:hypothetical protein